MSHERDRCFSFHYKALRYLGLGKFNDSNDNNFNNYPSFCYKFYAMFCLCINLVGYFISEATFAYKAFVEGREATLQFLSYTLVGIHFFAILKIFILIKNNTIIQKIIRVLEVDTKEFGYDSQKIQDYSIFVSKIITGCFLLFGELTITCMAIYPIKVDVERKRQFKESNYTMMIHRDAPFAAYVPWDTMQDGGYIAACLYSTIGMYWMGTTLIVCDTMIASIMTHISGQFRIVQKAVENVGEDAIEQLSGRVDFRKYNYKEPTFNGDETKSELFLTRKKWLLSFYTEQEFDVTMINCLKKAIKYHQLVIGITSDLQAAYSQAFLCQTLSSFYVIGLIFVQTAEDVSNIHSLRFFNNLGFLISILWQLFMQTYSANEITLQANNISDSAYRSYWYCMGSESHKMKRLLILLLLRAQKPVYLTAGKFSPLSNALFVTIMRTAYQVFTLVTTVMKGDK